MRVPEGDHPSQWAELPAWAAVVEVIRELTSLTARGGPLNRSGALGALCDPRHHRRIVDLPVEERPIDGGAGEPDPSLHEALAALSPDQRAAVVLVHAHGYADAEAADVLGIPLTSLKNHLHRGLSRLRAELEGRS